MPKLGPYPSKDADFNTYVQAAVTYLILNGLRLGITTTNQTALTDRRDEWNAAYPASQNANTRTRTTTKEKTVARKQMIVCFRSVYADIPASSLTNADRFTLNLPVRETVNTPNPVPTSKPVGQINTSRRLEHTISFIDEDGGTAKPRGVRGSQIWCKVGSPVTDVTELRFLTTDTSSPYLHKFEVEDAGKSVYYWLRWENTRGETGPWSDVVMATVNG
jgi:hypothetical protein